MNITAEKRLELTVQLCAGLLASGDADYITHNGDYWDFRDGQDGYAVIEDAQILLRNIESKINAKLST